MELLLAIGLSRADRAVLDSLGVRTPGLAVRMVRPEDLDGDSAGEPSGLEDVWLALVGSAHDNPVEMVQRVHGRWPEASVAVMPPADPDELRRQLMFAPGVPLDLHVLEHERGKAADELAELAARAMEAADHARLLRALATREVPQAAAPLARAHLGTLLEHAPVGVVVTDLAGSVLAWNHAAGDALSLDDSAIGAPVTALFEETDALTWLLDVETASGGPDSLPGRMRLRDRAGTVFEVSAARTRLEDGRDAVLLLTYDVSDRERLAQERDRLGEQVELIGRVSEALLGTTEPDDAMLQLADLAVPVLADWVVMAMYDDRGATRRSLVRHGDPALATTARALEESLPEELSDDTPSRQVARTRQPLLMSSVTEEDLCRFVPDPGVRERAKSLGVESVVAVPLAGRRTLLGSMVLVNRPGSPRLGERDLRVALELGRRAGTMVEALDLQRRQQVLAEELQRSLLTDPPSPDGLEVVVRYRPAADEAQVGGDWYDAFVQRDGSTVLVIGDVVGHDHRATAAMGQVRALLRGIGYTTGAGPSALLTHLDEALDGLDVDTIATAVVAQVLGGRGDQRRLAWSNAGHPPPAVLPADGPARLLETERCDLLLGVSPAVARQEVDTPLRHGDTLVLYTDGLVERRGRDIDQGVDDLLVALEGARGASVDDLCDHLLDALLPESREDDVALVAVRVVAG